MSPPPVHVIGAGLAGSEAAYFLAQRGIPVILHEMRPHLMTPAHHTAGCAELVCSNSFKSTDPVSAPGILKNELRQMGSLILKCGEESAIPGGQALTVDRDVFSGKVTQAIDSHPLITRASGEVTEPSTDDFSIIATGPLTSDGMSRWLAKCAGDEDLYFYDAIAPIIDASSIDPELSYIANRHDKGGEAAYINCPFEREEYEQFLDALLAAETVAPKNFEKEKFYAGCQPIEAIAASGRESLRFGPMKPVGLPNPKTGRPPWAVVQLRPENQSLTAYNMVGFQTKLTYPEQRRIFRMIPSLKQAEFLRLGSVHRNTYVCGPRVLRPDLSLRGNPRVFLAGQITGVEGYLESTSIGLMSAQFLWQRLKGIPHSSPPANTALGSLLRHICWAKPSDYQPSGIQFGLFETLLYDGVQGLSRGDARKKMALESELSFGTWWKSFC